MSKFTWNLALSKKVYNVDKMKGLTKKQKEKLKEIIKYQCKDAKRHFKNDGWDLSFDCIKSDILYDFFGADVFAVLASEILHQCKRNKLHIITNEDHRFVLRDPLYQPVFIHKNTGELFIPKNEKEEKKRLRSEGYTLLGRL